MNARPREVLPWRRVHIADTLVWNGADYRVSAGFNDSGQVREIFVDGPKPGSDHEVILQDAAILLSLLLQSHFSTGQLARHLGADSARGPASLLAAIAATAAALEAAHGPAMERAYLATRGENDGMD